VASGGALRAAVTGTLAFVLLAACAGAGAGPRRAQPDPARSVVALDEAVDVVVGGRRLTARCAGDPDDPSVVLVSGLGLDMRRSWRSVQPRIGAFARVCAYDRLGVGRSERARRPQTFADMAYALRSVIAELDLREPVVVVAHSLGGMVAAELARQDPDVVGGLVLIDAPGPGYPEQLLRRLPTRAGAAGSQVRAAWESLLDPASNPERLDGARSFAAADALGGLGDVPLIALTHSISYLGATLRPRQAADLESAWEKGQHRWLALSSRAWLERVDLAGHFIQDDHPAVVVDTVSQLLVR
jgi:pimeloyl-ACP methyl ester carboxylesterase